MTSFPRALSDILVVSAVPLIEDRAMLAAFGLRPTGKSAVTTESGNKYWLVDVKTKSGPRRVALTCINGQGQVMATAHTERSVADTKCRTAFLVGFCAGLPDKTGVGEVITSRTVIGYEPARLEAQGAMPQPEHANVPHSLLQEVVAFDPSACDWPARYSEAVKLLNPADIAFDADRAPFRYENAIFASGEKLLADGSLNKLRKKHHEKIRAGDKEAIGFALACQGRPTPVPWLVLKGISDFGGRDKDEKTGERMRQLSASIRAATYLRALIEEGLTFPRLVDLRDPAARALPASFPRLDLKIGFVGTVANSKSKFGTETINGVRTAFDEYATSLSEMGIGLKLLEHEDQGDPDRSADLVKDLAVDEKVLAIIGPGHSGCALRVRNVATDHMCLIISPTATAAELTEGYEALETRWFLSMQRPNIECMRTVVRELRESRRGRILAFFEEHDSKGNRDIYGTGGWHDFEQCLKETFAEAQSVGIGHRRNLNQSEAQQILLKGGDEFRNRFRSRPQALVMITLEDDLLEFARAKADTPLKNVPFYLPNFKSLIERRLFRFFSNTELLVGFHPADSDRFVRQFAKLYKRRFNCEPTPMAAAGYDAALTILMALKDLASVVRFRDGSSPTWLRREFLRTGIVHSSFQGARGFVAFDQHGTCGMRLRLIKINKAGYRHVLV